MKRIVIIGAGDFQNPLIVKAKELGYETHVFAWKCGDIGEGTADYFYPISIVEKEKILSRCKKIHPHAIASIASDLAMVTVNYVAESLGLPCNGAPATLKSTNKYEMRLALREAGVDVPAFYRVTSKNPCPAGLAYPVIVKPTDRSGSRGVSRVEHPRELEAAVRKAAAYSFEHCAIVEEFIDGPEYSCEGISYNGEHTLLAFTEKFTTGAPHFIETGHIEPAGLTEEVEFRAKKTIQTALTALGVREGASHSEFRLSPDGSVKLIEIGARMGGDCIGSHLVPYTTGYDYLKMVLDTALGNAPEFALSGSPCPTAIRFIFSLEDLKETERLGNACTVRACSRVLPFDHPVVDSSTRFGFTVFSAPTRELLCAAMPQCEITRG